MKTSFPHYSPKIRFTPFRCRSNWASVILCEQGCRAIICLFSKVALRRFRRSNPSTSTNPKEIVTPLDRVAFLFDVRQLQIYLQDCLTSNKSYSTLSITISFGFSVSPDGEQRAVRNAVEQSEVNPLAKNEKRIVFLILCWCFYI